ncbi:MAG TPA: gliding motility-associated C-terminal domain-containing protein [Tangfeifania sp.]|nr:gliding motility-associated C-terminal domain-containing protein [Tangfeifania sp.]
MILIILQILTIILPASVPPDSHEEIWKESFSMPEKGIWADGDGNLVSDFSDVTTWTLEYQNVSLENPDDYAKTVTTSGGRFECRDIDGEVVWRSEKIDISEFDEVSVKLTAYETGSSNNHDNKYLKVFYRIDDGDEILFETNGEISGNWGSAEVAQAGLKGESIEIICYMANHYSADKVTLDEVTVSAKVSYPEIEPGDVIINEILFNPVPEGNDYVELFNLSEKEIPLKNLYLASRDNDLQLTQIYRLTEKNTRFNPGSFLALTKDTNGIFPFYFIECETCFRQMEKFPSFNNDDDYVVLLNEKMEIIDELFYTEDWHHEMLADEKGVSLERISAQTKTNNPENWASASGLAGYGTPGYKNSQAATEINSGPLITFEPEAFSPNLDGYNDEYQIHYQLNKPGYLANILIFDAAGRFVLQLANNEILPTSGTIKWNGEDETGQKLPMGVYVVMVEIFNTEGAVHKFKDGVVLTERMD